MRRRLGAVIVVIGAGAFAACYTAALSSTAAFVLDKQCGSNPCATPDYDFGTGLTLNVTVATPFVGSDPYFKLFDATQADLVTSIARDMNCSPDFQLVLPPQAGSGGDTFVNAITIGHICSGGAGSSLAPNTGSCSDVPYYFGGTFTPRIPGLQSCQVIVTYMGSGAGSGSAMVGSALALTMTGSGSAPPFAMTVTPATTSSSNPFDLGTVPTGTPTAPLSVIVTNVGSNQLDVTSALAGTGASVYSVPGVPGTFTLDPSGSNQSRTFDVICTPAPAGTYTANLGFSTPSNENSLSDTVFMTCKGVTTNLSWTPTSYDFGKVLVGTPTKTITVTFSASGGGSATLQNFALASSVPASELHFDTTPPGSTTVGSGTTFQLGVDFGPTQEHPSGSLGKITFDAGSNSFSIPITDGAFAGSISTNPASVDFGQVCVGASPAPSLTIEVYANASGDVTIQSDSVLPHASPFSASASAGLPFTLHGDHSGASLLVTTTFTPTMASDTPFTDQIVLDTDIPGAQPKRTTPVKGTVLPAGISATPSAIAFEPVKIRTPSSVQTVTLTNCGSGPLMVSDKTISGSQSADFTASPFNAMLPATLQPTETITFLVNMVPSGTGTRTASLDIIHSSGTTSVALSGNGVGDDRQTYYACSAGARPIGLAPFVLALAFALRRRRR